MTRVRGSHLGASKRSPAPVSSLPPQEENFAFFGRRVSNQKGIALMAPSHSPGFQRFEEHSDVSREDGTCVASAGCCLDTATQWPSLSLRPWLSGCRTSALPPAGPRFNPRLRLRRRVHAPDIEIRGSLSRDQKDFLGLGRRPCGRRSVGSSLPGPTLAELHRSCRRHFHVTGERLSALLVAEKRDSLHMLRGILVFFASTDLDLAWRLNPS